MTGDGKNFLPNSHQWKSLASLHYIENFELRSLERTVTVCKMNMTSFLIYGFLLVCDHLSETILGTLES
jgi:hypothetical protein